MGSESLPSIEEIGAVLWEERKSPVISPKKPSYYVGDPTTLLPEESPDGKYHLFAQGELGISHYSSSDGISFENRGLAVLGGLRPFVMRDSESGKYALFYEKADLFALKPAGLLEISRKLSETEQGGNPLAAFLPENLDILRSHVEARVSRDLGNWGEPTIVLEPKFPFQSEREESPPGRTVVAKSGRGVPILPASRGDVRRIGTGNVGNPTVVPAPGGGFFLYASSGQSLIPDCGFYEPKHVVVAKSGSLLGQYSYVGEEPLASPKEEDAFCNLASGGFRVLRARDGYVSFQNGIFLDDTGKSSSQIRLLASEDGLSGWTVLRESVFSPGPGIDYVYTAHPSFDSKGNARAYYNARRGRAQPGTEEILASFGKIGKDY